jgi:hypothetical protein
MLVTCDRGSGKNPVAVDTDRRGRRQRSASGRRWRESAWAGCRPTAIYGVQRSIENESIAVPSRSTAWLDKTQSVAVTRR